MSDHRADTTGAPGSRVRILLFLVVMLVILAIVVRSDGEYAHIARHFLSNLLRHLF